MFGQGLVDVAVGQVALFLGEADEVLDLLGNLFGVNGGFAKGTGALDRCWNTL